MSEVPAYFNEFDKLPLEGVEVFGRTFSIKAISEDPSFWHNVDKLEKIFDLGRKKLAFDLGVPQEHHVEEDIAAWEGVYRCVLAEIAADITGSSLDSKTVFSDFRRMAFAVHHTNAKRSKAGPARLRRIAKAGDLRRDTVLHAHNYAELGLENVMQKNNGLTHIDPDVKAGDLGAHKEPLVDNGKALSLAVGVGILGNSVFNPAMAAAQASERTLPTSAQVAEEDATLDSNWINPDQIMADVETIMETPITVIERQAIPMEMEHVVRDGETLSEIAQSYRVNMSDISNVQNPDDIKVGQVLHFTVNSPYIISSNQEVAAIAADLGIHPGTIFDLGDNKFKIPVNASVVSVAEGDSLTSLGVRSMDEALRLNPDMDDPNIILAGSNLALPLDLSLRSVDVQPAQVVAEVAPPTLPIPEIFEPIAAEVVASPNAISFLDVDLGEPNSEGRFMVPMSDYYDFTTPTFPISGLMGTPEVSRCISETPARHAVTFARAFNQVVPSVEIVFGHFDNAKGHASHELGVDYDIYFSDQQEGEMASHHYQRTLLAFKIAALTGVDEHPGGVLKTIGHTNPELVAEFNAWAEANGLDVRGSLWDNHERHVHIRFKDQFQLPEISPGCADDTPPSIVVELGEATIPQYIIEEISDDQLYAEALEAMGQIARQTVVVKANVTLAEIASILQGEYADVYGSFSRDEIVAEIARLSGIEDVNKIVEGQEIVIGLLEDSTIADSLQISIDELSESKIVDADIAPAELEDVEFSLDQFSPEFIAIINDIPTFGYAANNYDINNPGPKITNTDVAMIAINSGWTGEDLRIAVALAIGAESPAAPFITNTNATNNIDVGLWQINFRPSWADETFRDPQENLDPTLNGLNAFELFNEQGWNAWIAYKNGKHTAFIGDADTAIAEAMAIAAIARADYGIELDIDIVPEPTEVTTPEPAREPVREPAARVETSPSENAGEFNLDHPLIDASTLKEDNGKTGERVFVVQVDGDEYINAEVAIDFAELLSAARADGVDLFLLDGWRSYGEQEDLRVINECPDLYEASPNECKVPTAIPGTSNHNNGEAGDFRYRVNGVVKKINSRDNPAYRWLAANAEKYGLFNLPSEPWHWSTNGR